MHWFNWWNSWNQQAPFLEAAEFERKNPFQIVEFIILWCIILRRKFFAASHSGYASIYFEIDIQCTKTFFRFASFSLICFQELLDLFLSFFFEEDLNSFKLNSMKQKSSYERIFKDSSFHQKWCSLGIPDFDWFNGCSSSKYIH